MARRVSAHQMLATQCCNQCSATAYSAKEKKKQKKQTRASAWVTRVRQRKVCSKSSTNCTACP